MRGRGVVGFVLAALLIGGCESKNRRVRDMSDLGSMHVSTLSVTRWDDFKASLSPAFKLDAAGALNAAVPDSRSFESSVLDAFKAKLGIKLAPDEVLVPGFSTDDDGTPNTTAAGSGVPKPTGAGENGQLGAEDKAPGAANLGGDAFLRYTAATALFQEVKMLERYVQDAVQRKDYQAFIVRMQIANMPSSDRAGYDAYANIGFFSEPVSAPGTVSIGTVTSLRSKRAGFQRMDGSALSPELLRFTDRLDDLLELVDLFQRLDSRSDLNRGIQNLISEARLDLVNQSGLTATEKKGIDTVLENLLSEVKTAIRVRETPIVVPLLVTDQVEAALISGRHERLRELALAVSAAYAGIGGDVDLSKVDQAIEKAAGRSYRSLFSVGRLSDNALRVRMGARVLPVAGDSGQRYETMARSHFVTALVLVHPDNTGAEQWLQDVHLASRFEYRWPDTGRLVDPLNSQGDHRRVYRAARRLIDDGGYGLSGTPEGLAYEMLVAAQSNQYELFMDLVRGDALVDGKRQPCLDISAEIARRLYLDLQIAKVGGDFDSSQFAVRMLKDGAPSFGTANIYMVDDGTHTIATLDGVRGIDPSKVSATWQGLQVTDPGDAVSVASSGAELNGRSQLIIRFPSLLQLKIIPKGGKLADAGELKLSHPNVTSNQPVGVASHIAEGSEPPKPKLELAVAGGKIEGSKCTFKLKVDLGKVLDQPSGVVALAKAVGETHFAVEFKRVRPDSKDKTILDVSELQPAIKSGTAMTMISGSKVYVVVSDGEIEFEIPKAANDGDVEKVQSKDKIRIVITNAKEGQTLVGGKPMATYEIKVTE